MAADPVRPWATAVRVLAVISLVLLTIAVVEARALRSLRAELQQLRSSCVAAVPRPSGP